MTERRPTPASLEIVAAVLVPAAVLGFARVFTTWRDVAPVVVASLLSSLLAALLRRARVPLVIAAVLSIVGLAELIIARYAPGTTRYGLLPTGDTREALRLLVDDGVTQFRELRAPVEPLPPFIAAAIIGAWVLAFLTDWAAMRLRLAFEPVLPAALLFIFSSILGSGQRQISSTVIFATAVALWAVVQRTQTLSEGVWLTVDRTRGPFSVLRSASLVAVVAIVAGVFSGPRLPGAGTDELYDWRNQSDPTRQVTSPYVSIEKRLASQQNIEMFTVVADRPAYWRLAGLDGFSGNVWTTKGGFEKRNGDLPGAATTSGTTATLDQTFTITGLSEIWLPAAFAPSRLLDTGDATITWNAEISSLTVDNERPDSDGLTYELQSVLPLFTAEELRAAPAVADRDLLERYTALPGDLSPIVAQEAQRLTAGIATQYDQMIALQSEFQTFDYSLELSPRVGDPIEQFLAERIGFCQQFSGTFAAMARSLGIPARVAVGFTWGDPVDGKPNTYRVTGRHAHAWPEVYFEGFGWVAFEPTPGRGAPGATHTGLDPRQDSPVEATPTTPTTVDPGSVVPPTLPDDFLVDPGFADTGDTTTATDPGFTIPWRLVAVVAALAAYCLGMPALARLRRARRWAAASTPAEQIEAIWSNLSDDLERNLRLSRPAALTRREWAERLIKDRRLPDEPLRRLGGLVTDARFAPAGSLDAAAVADAEADAEAVRTVIHRRVSRFQRWLRLLDPRWLISGTRRQAVVLASS
ncbi:MAG: transglutaminaseTgpA domain-containing protein [Acidimicrobiales bacterium]